MTEKGKNSRGPQEMLERKRELHRVIEKFKNLPKRDGAGLTPAQAATPTTNRRQANP